MPVEMEEGGGERKKGFFIHFSKVKWRDSHLDARSSFSPAAPPSFFSLFLFGVGALGQSTLPLKA